jgi:hypothetical protein
MPSIFGLASLAERIHLPALRIQKILAGEDSWLSMSGLWISSIGKKRNDL